MSTNVFKISIHVVRVLVDRRLGQVAPDFPGPSSPTQNHVDLMLVLRSSATASRSHAFFRRLVALVRSFIARMPLLRGMGRTEVAMGGKLAHESKSSFVLISRHQHTACASVHPCRSVDAGLFRKN